MSGADAIYDVFAFVRNDHRLLNGARLASRHGRLVISMDGEPVAVLCCPTVQ